MNAQEKITTTKKNGKVYAQEKNKNKKKSANQKK